MFSFRFIIPLVLAVFSLIYTIMLEPLYRTTQLYWMIYAVLALLFWLAAFYPKYSWSEMNKWQRIAFVALAIHFCSYFLPIEIILNPIFQKTQDFVGSLIAVGYWYSKDDDNSGGKRKKKKIQKRRSKLRLANYTA